MQSKRSQLMLLLLGAAACSGDAASTPADAGQDAAHPDSSSAAADQTLSDQASQPDAKIGPVKLVQAFAKLTFDKPLALVDPGDGSGRLMVAEQSGRVRVFSNSPGVASSRVFLDLTSKVDTKGWEEGLLGLAFHPKYKSNGLLYVNYTATSPDRTVVARYKVSAKDPDAADPASAVVLLTVAQPFENHNGGHLLFGPDGMLYIGLGDGGAGGDPQDNGQNPKTLLGAMLRIDVDNPAAGKGYGVPKDNPFVGNTKGWREEVYAYGLRNPWRYSFDAKTGWLWLGDVGQNAWEEIDVIKKGGNYGWRTMEGSHCFDPPKGCSKAGLEQPVWDYTLNGPQSVTGGYVYRGPGVPQLTGAYIYADFISGQIWRLTYDGKSKAKNEPLIKTKLSISSFGQDAKHELYVCAFDGKIYRFE